MEDPAYAPVFRKALEDSSYRVVSVAMRELARLEPEEALAIAERYQGVDNISIMVGVLRIFASHGGPEKNGYFIQTLAEQDGFEQYLVIQSYGNFLARQDDFPTVLSGCQALADAAGNSSIWWMSQVAQGAIQEVIMNYEVLKESLDKSETSKSKELETNIAALESILENMDSN